MMLFTLNQNTYLQLESHISMVKKHHVQVFVVLCDEYDVVAGLYDLAVYGAVYSVLQSTNSTTITQIINNIRNQAEIERRQHIFSALHTDINALNTFRVEAGLEADLIVALSIDDESKVENFELVNPDGEKNIFAKFQDGLVYFRFPGKSATGVWTYRVKMYDDQNSTPEPYTVDVSVTETGPDAIIATVSTNRDKDVDPTDDSKTIISTRLNRDEIPVRDAKVEAIIEGTAGYRMKVELVDDGMGYPDSMAGDGLYSGLVGLNSLNKGPYTVKVIVTDNSGKANVEKKSALEYLPGGLVDTVCCGSTLPSVAEVPTGMFTRILSAPSFYIESGSGANQQIFVLQSGGTGMSPARVLDLRIVEEDPDARLRQDSRKVGRPGNNSLGIHLTWTSPADDGIQGKASYYEIRTATSLDNLSEDNFSSKGILVHSSLTPTPQSKGKREDCTVGVPWPNQLFYYGLVGIDAEGNRAEVSNIVSIFIKEETTTTTTTTTTSTSTTTTTTTTTVTTTSTTTTTTQPIMYIIPETTTTTSTTTTTTSSTTKPVTTAFTTPFFPFLDYTDHFEKDFSDYNSIDRVSRNDVFSTPADVVYVTKGGRSLPRPTMPSIKTVMGTTLPTHVFRRPITPRREFLSIRELFTGKVDLDEVNRANQRQRTSRLDRTVEKNKAVYVATGVGGFLLLLALLTCIFILSRYRRMVQRKFVPELLDGDQKPAKQFDLGQLGTSFHQLPANGLNKIYTLIRPKILQTKENEYELRGNKGWLNPLARPASEAGSHTSNQTACTDDNEKDMNAQGADEQRRRGSGILVDVDRYIREHNRGLVRSKSTSELLDCDKLAAVDDRQIQTVDRRLAKQKQRQRARSLDPIEATASAKFLKRDEGTAKYGKLLREVYSGGTFKKSMNYFSFRDKSSREEETSPGIEKDSLEVSGLSELPSASSGLSKNSRASILNAELFTNPMLEINTVEEDTAQVSGATSPSENDKSIGTMSGLDVKHRYYFGGDEPPTPGSQPANPRPPPPDFKPVSILRNKGEVSMIKPSPPLQSPQQQTHPLSPVPIIRSGPSYSPPGHSSSQLSPSYSQSGSALSQPSQSYSQPSQSYSSQVSPGFQQEANLRSLDLVLDGHYAVPKGVVVQMYDTLRPGNRYIAKV